MNKKDEFKQKCQRISDQLGLADPEFYEDSDQQDPFYDDGTLHVVKYGVRACFHLDEDTEGSLQNERTRIILGALNMKRKINDRVLVDDDLNAEEEYCPHCGRGYEE